MFSPDLTIGQSDVTISLEQASICFPVTSENSFVLPIHCHLKTGPRAHRQLDNILFSASTPTVLAGGFPHRAEALNTICTQKKSI